MTTLYTATALSPDAAEVAEYLRREVERSQLCHCGTIHVSNWIASALVAMLTGTATGEQRGMVAAELAAVNEVIERLTRLAGERAAGKRKRKAAVTR